MTKVGRWTTLRFQINFIINLIFFIFIFTRLNMTVILFLYYVISIKYHLLLKQIIKSTYRFDNAKSIINYSGRLVLAVRHHQLQINIRKQKI